MSARAKQSKKKRELGRYVIDLDSMEIIAKRDLGRYGEDFHSDEELERNARRLPEDRYTKVFDFVGRGLEDLKEFQKIFVNHEDFNDAFIEGEVVKAGLDAKRGFLDVSEISCVNQGGPIGTTCGNYIWRIPVRKV